MAKQLCMKCMRQYDAGEAVCPVCGNVHGKENIQPHTLRPGTFLQGNYVVGGVLGQGGFGITYIGFDWKLQMKVAIKEYFPRDSTLVNRNNQVGPQVVWTPGAQYEAIRRTSIESFLKEARKMAKLTGIPGVVGVKDFFEENNTAYIVMTFIEGQTVKEQLMKTGVLSFARTVEIVTPVMEALDKVHKNGIIHRDISPDNIMIDRNGTVWLLDLGAAKDMEPLSDGLNHEASQMVTKQGFSPYEQSMTSGHIGAWTDVYAMCATIYYCVTGHVPPVATDRAYQDTFACLPPLTQAQFDVLRMGMTIRSEERVQTMGEMLRLLRSVVSGQAMPGYYPQNINPSGFGYQQVPMSGFPYSNQNGMGYQNSPYSGYTIPGNYQQPPVSGYQVPSGYPNGPYSAYSIPNGYQQVPMSQVNPSGFQQVPVSQVNPSGFQTVPMSQFQQVPVSQVNPSGFQQVPMSQMNPSGFQQAPVSQVNPSGFQAVPVSQMNAPGGYNQVSHNSPAAPQQPAVSQNHPAANQTVPLNNYLKSNSGQKPAAKTPEQPKVKVPEAPKPKAPEAPKPKAPEAPKPPVQEPAKSSAKSIPVDPTKPTAGKAAVKPEPVKVVEVPAASKASKETPKAAPVKKEEIKVSPAKPEPKKAEPKKPEPPKKQEPVKAPEPVKKPEKPVVTPPAANTKQEKKGFPIWIPAVAVIAVILLAVFFFTRSGSDDEVTVQSATTPAATTAATEAPAETEATTAPAEKHYDAIANGVHPIRSMASLNSLDTVDDDPFWGQDEIARKAITSIQFKGNVSSIPTYAWDISKNGDETVLAWVDNGVLTVGTNGTVQLNEDSSYLFRLFTNVQSIDFGKCVDTSLVTNMDHLFADCQSLAAIDLSGFNTAKVTSTRYMFNRCYKLKSIDLSGFSTSALTDMDYMFNKCKALTNLNLSGFSTRKVVTMNSTFYDCSSLATLNVSGMDVSNVNDMRYMFYGCSSLTTLDVKSWTYKSTVNMENMFSGCSKLKLVYDENTQYKIGTAALG